LLWLAIVSPFLLFPDRRWAWLAVVIPGLWIVRYVAHGRFLPSTPLDWPIALLMAMVAVSLFATFSIEYSLPKITGMVLGVGLYYALVDWMDTDGRARWAVWGFVAAGAGLAIVGLLGTNWLDKMQGLSDVTRGLPRVVPGLPGAESGFQPNEVAGTLVLVALPAFALAFWTWSVQRSWRERAAALCIFVSIALTLLLTQSRGALTGAAVGLLLVLWLLAPRLRIWLAGGTLVGLVALLLNDPVAIANKLLTPSVARFPTTDPANLAVRRDIWSSALAVIRDAPLTGSGMNTFRYIMPERYPSQLIPAGWDVAHAHNVFLQVTIDLGLPGLIAYVAIYVIAAILLVRTFRSAPTAWHKAIAAGLGAGLLALLIFGITDTVALGAKPGAFFWTLLSICSALWIQTRHQGLGSISRELLQEAPVPQPPDHRYS
jgi:putative inorganic carbon (HCO3(-)) transporter